MTPLSKTIEDLCHPYCLYSDMIKAGVKTAEMLGVTDTSKALGAAAQAVLPEMYDSLNRQRKGGAYYDTPRAREGISLLKAVIKRVEGVTK